MGFWDYAIIISVVLLLALAVFLVVRRKKAGKGSCSACEHYADCPMRKNAQKETEHS